MQFTILYSLLVAVIGLLIYFRVVNPKWQEVGRIMFAAGMFAFCFQLQGYKVSGGTGAGTSTYTEQRSVP